MLVRATRICASRVAGLRVDGAQRAWQAAGVQCGRRAWLGGFVGAATTCALGTYASADASAAPAPFELLPLEAPGRGAQRATLLVPRHLAPGARVRLLVALHGLGEAHDPALGVRAWPELYGLRSAYDRLVRAPITPLGTRGEWTPERLGEVNQSLAAAPFRGVAVACPFCHTMIKDGLNDTKKLD